MSLAEQLNTELKNAMRARDQLRLTALRGLRGEIIKLTKTGKPTEIDDDQVRQLVKTQVKQRQDSIASFTSGGRLDLIAKEEAELAILQEFLPPPLDAEELTAIIAAAIAETGATGMRDMGQVMLAVRAAVDATGKDADSREVAARVKSRLQAGT